MYAITGITGKVGGQLARALRARDLLVRAVVRDAGKAGEWAALGCEIAVATMEDAGALTRAFADATGVFILPPPVFDPTPGDLEAGQVIDAVIAALDAARPRKVLCLSTIGADAIHETLLSPRLAMETALRELALPLTILRPAWFTDNAAWDVTAARDTGLLQSFLLPLDRPIPMVAAGDVGRTAAALIQETWTGTRIVEIEGPSRVSPNDLAAAFSAALSRVVTPVVVPREAWEALFRSQGMNNPTPRMRMLDGFNEGWIAFTAGGANVRKGTTGVAEVVASLVAADPFRPS